MKGFLVLVVLVAFPFLTSPLWAHGDTQHILGTVTKTAEDHVVVTTTKGESVSITFRADTSFQHNGITKKDARPQVGDRLVAEVSQDGEDLVADEIRFSTPKAK